VAPGVPDARHADLVRRLADLGRAGVVATRPEPRFARVVRLARQIFDVPTAHVALAGTEVATGPEPAWLFRAEQPLLDPEGGLLGTLVIADTRRRDLTADQDALLRDLARWVSKEIAVDAELDHAQRVQLGLLPHDAPRVPGYQVAGSCLPGRTLGGDFYDWYPVDGGVVLTLADVMGEGPAAAILAAATRIALRASADGLPVDRALARAGVTLHADLVGAGVLATAFHARLDAATGDVTYADAGHGLTLVVRADGGAERLDALGLPLGVSEDARREAAVVRLGPGDLLLSVSDGALALVDGTPGGLGLLAAQVAGCTTADDAVQRVLRLVAAVDGRVHDLAVVALRRQAR
jgi:serine phosphatase RsbU (regulator of sigma subunit)